MRISIPYKEAVEDFKENVLPGVIETYGRDNAAMRQAWNNYTDGLLKSGLITSEQYHNWDSPCDQTG